MNKDKDLLFKDLCARLPYKLICEIDDRIRLDDDEISLPYNKILSVNILVPFIEHNDFYIKPYLRSMSSMTEKEKKELNYILEFQYYADDSCMCESTDWLNAHHFDYRGLIDKGLAIEAPEGMYK